MTTTGPSPLESTTGLPAPVEWATEAPEVIAQFIAIALVTTAGAFDQQHREGYGFRHDNKPLLYGS